MITELQRVANIENSRRSTGPRTEAGKLRSSLSARRHQLTAKTYIAPPEELAAFDAHRANWYEALRPIGVYEKELVDEIAQDKWRLKRARAIENSIFAQGHNEYAEDMASGSPLVDAALAEAETWKQQAECLKTLTVYESRLRRAVEKNTEKLESLQAARIQAYDTAQNQAVALVRLAAHEAPDEEYDPGADFDPPADHGGFVYSKPALQAFVDRKNRLRRASLLSDPNQTVNQTEKV